MPDVITDAEPVCDDLLRLIAKEGVYIPGTMRRMARELLALRARVAQLEAERRWRPIEEWREDMGDKMWTMFPIVEAPYIGSPLDCGKSVRVKVEASMEDPHEMTVQVGGWPGYHTHFCDILLPPPPADDRHE